MRKALLKIYWVGILIMLVTVVVASGMVIGIAIDEEGEHLHDILEASTAWTLESSEDLQSMTDSIASISPFMRVTFVSEDGVVLSDSDKNPEELDNHLNRPEMVEVMETGVGQSLRLSETKDTVMFYLAEWVRSNLILRLGIPIVEITRIPMFYGVGLVVLFLILHILYRRSLDRFIQSLNRQMDDIRLLLEGDFKHREAVFPELQPAMTNFSYLAERLYSNLDEVNRTLSLRNDFVANASHELRSPLTSIMGFAEMLDEGLADTPQEQELCVKTIRAECERMLEVIEDVLQLSRTERQKELNKEPVNVSAVAAEVCQALGPQAAESGITLHVTGEATVMAVEKDIWEILYNLTDNAIRYGKPNGYVNILLKPGAIIVEDDGIGVDQAHLPHLFEQFYRVDQSRDSTVRGTGLGLSIVRALAERNGGKISVESELGKGSRFIVQFNVES